MQKQIKYDKLIGLIRLKILIKLIRMSLILALIERFSVVLRHANQWSAHGVKVSNGKLDTL